MRTEFPKMKCIHVITPVKDSIDTTMCTVRSVMSSVVYKIPFIYEDDELLKLKGKYYALYEGKAELE